MTVTQAKMGDNGSESGLADPPEQSITPNIHMSLPRASPMAVMLVFLAVSDLNH